MVKETKIFWMAMTALNFIILLCFYIGATAFFNRGPGMDWHIYFMLVGAPVMIFTVFSIVCFVTGRVPRTDAAQLRLVIALVCITCFIIFTAPFPIEREGWLTERVTTQHGGIQTTEDGKYKYSLEIINSGQRNSHGRLYVRNVATGEEARIPLNMNNTRPSVFSFNEERAWSHLVPSEVLPSMYILTTTEHFNRSEIEIFEICMETKTSRRFQTERHYRSDAKMVRENEQYSYTYYILLIDRYEGDNKISTEALFVKIDHLVRRTYRIPMPVDKELLENDNLRGVRSPMWITMEETDIPGQFIVETTEILSEEITLRFLIDIETETSQRVE